MVVARLYGGLGNQMFQYAAALAVARRLDTRLFVDTAWFSPRAHPAGAPPRPYGLAAFGIASTMPRLPRLAFKLGRPTVIRESDPGYQSDLEHAKGNVILDGYWQSHRYFAPVDTEVRRAFQFPPNPSPAAKRWLHEVDNPGSVSVHVRRGDYVTNPKRARKHGVVSTEYYEAAVAELRRRRGSLRLFVFSDDLCWCRTNLFRDLVEEVTFVDDTTADHEDMLLMSRCRDHVIANSSFSWWGAWLSENPEKTVIAPARWFADPQVREPDLIPDEWLRL